MGWSTGRWSIAALLVATPWLNPFTYGPSPAVQPWLTSAACALGLWLWAMAHSARPRLRLWLPALAVLAWAVLSQMALRPETVMLGMGLLLVGVAAGLAEDEGATTALQAGMLAAAAISAVFGIVQYLGASEIFEPWINFARPGEAYGNLRQPNQFATLCWLGMAVLLWGTPRLPRGWTIGCAIVLATAAASSVSRTGLLQGFLLLALCLVWRGPDRRRNLELCVVAALAYIAATMLLPVLLEAVTGAPPARRLLSRLSSSYGCSSRSVLWSNVATLIAQRPLTGWGWGELDFAHFVTLYTGPRFCEILDNAHNLPLHLAVELGLPAAILVCVGGLVWGWRQRPWRERESRRQLAWALIAVILLHNMLEYPLWYGPFQIAFGASLGWLLTGAARQPLAPARATVASGALAALLAGVCAYAAWDYWRVSQVYLPPQQRRDVWRSDPLGEARRSRLFAAQAKFAELTLSTVSRGNAATVAALAREMLHYSPEPRVVERLIEADTMLGNEQEAVLTLARFRAAYPAEYEAWRRAQGLTLTSAPPGSQD